MKIHTSGRMAAAPFSPSRCFSSRAMVSTGVEASQLTPVLNRCFARHPADTSSFQQPPGSSSSSLKMSALCSIHNRVTQHRTLRTSRCSSIVQSETDEVIQRSTQSVSPGPSQVHPSLLHEGVSHFDPLQRPEQFLRRCSHSQNKPAAANLKERSPIHHSASRLQRATKQCPAIPHQASPGYAPCRQSASRF